MKTDNKVRLFIYIEKYQKNWLKQEAKKRKMSIAKIIRYWIDYAINKK